MAGFVYAWGMQEQETPTTIPDLKQVVLRLAQPHERPRWDALMNQHHYLGFKQFAGRGLRYVAEYEGEWLALVGWQTGVFQCRPRDRWLGWHKAVQFRRLHLIANNTRFLVLPEGAGVQHLASRVLGLNLRRLSQDWQQRWGHPIELAETFVDPQLYRGTVYLAANWIQLGLSKGYARSNGQYTDKHGKRKQMLVYPLRARARARLADPQERPEWACGAVDVRYAAAELRSLRAQLEAVEDSRSCHGRRHPLAVVLALQLLARLAGRVGGRAAEAYAKTLTAEELGALGCRRDPTTGEYVTPSDTTFQRVMERTDPASLERALERWTQPRVAASALAGDGKRIRGANRLSAAGQHWETVTLVDHSTGIPVASRSYREEGGEQAALRALLEEVDLRGRTVTLDAGHAGRETERAIVEQHGGHIMVRIKGNCELTHATLSGLNWELGAERSWAEDGWKPSRQGDLEKRSIHVFTPHPKLLPFPHAQQAYRITHERCARRGGAVKRSYSYGITSLPQAAASAHELLVLQRGHWRVESANHYRRDKVFGEDASRVRTGHGPANNAALNNLALALLLSQRQFETVPEAQIYSAGNRDKALQLLLREN